MLWWWPLLIGIIFGAVIGAVITRFRIKKLYQQQIISHNLIDNKESLKEYHDELINYFAHSIELIDNLAQDHRRLYQYITENSNDFLLSRITKNTPLNNNFDESEADNDQFPKHITQSC